MKLRCPVRRAHKLTNNLPLAIKVAKGVFDVALRSNKHLAFNVLAIAGDSADLLVTACRPSHARLLLGGRAPSTGEYVINTPIVSAPGGGRGFAGWARSGKEFELILVVDGRKGVGDNRAGLVVEYRNDATS